MIGQQLFIEKAGLPSAILDQIKRLAAFQNPEFYRKQRLRLSTLTTPRIISCATELPQHIALPRDCQDALVDLLHAHGVELTVDHHRRPGEALDVCFQGTAWTPCFPLRLAPGLVGLFTDGAASS